MKTLSLALLGAGAALLSLALADQRPLQLKHDNVKRPNIVFILTDDQDLHLQSLDYQPFLQKHLIDRGTFFRRHYCTIAICCPSRVSLWTGKAAHNTNVTDVSPPYGGYPKFVSQGLNEDYLPVWLQAAGYNTYYTGKLFNSHNLENYASPYPAGFTGSDFLLDPHTYEYLNSTWQRNREQPISREGEYSTDILAEKAFGFLDDAVSEDNPFVLTIAPIAPHSNAKISEGNVSEEGGKHSFQMTAPIPAERHRNLFQDAHIPRTENFNPEKASSVSWIRSLPRQDEENVAYNDHFYRSRLRALQAVDEIIDGLISRLEEYDILQDTYIIYTSDNGYHIGQHRLQPGKECSFEEDINVPLIIRGPGVPEGEVADVVTSHTDLAPTFLKLLGVEPKEDFDGVAIPITRASIDQAKTGRHEHVNVEFWGYGIEEGDYVLKKPDFALHANNTYKALRLIGRGYNIHYSVWCNNEHELYNLEDDPYQMNNLLDPSEGHASDSSSSSLLGFPLLKVAARLDALLLVLKSCKRDECIHPWRVLHPAGNVNTLWDALDSVFDQFYVEEQAKVEFSRCEPGYILDAEGPKQALMYRDGLRWSEWV
ncbi:Arylsulphatase [Xylona heveae TC161]|uniref:Arylsulfatase n=1 Tax=Xylona heveae (strain CBS 132557 / TC161) TaxID=1328760 RepID=A0A164ZWR0_XYLHT|nr:Arylsulphatase [Xylona heveae TC161]KZF19630.1 Arylsulphatase [Xylona heveae TC161]